MGNEKRRVRNKRGEGARLRDEIVAAATALLEETGSEDAITLRAVARRAGIAAPSIYAHFPDRDAIVTAVVARAFAELDDTLAAAVHADSDPLRRLRNLCAAYLDFAQGRPHRYRVAFGRYRVAAPPDTREPGRLENLSGGQAFARLVTAVADYTEADRVTGHSPQLDATALWVSLHGYASLAAAVPAFPWPDRQEMLTTLLDRAIATTPDARRE